ncbi:UvrD-helicase domain-containing protein [Aquirufa sp. HETE-83D]|uniref:DNA 3'-5' helicase n=1 Tax=Aquirufa esocilacus TaxID=3096513 RepID=A0ABW6DJC6_9BACT
MKPQQITLYSASAGSGKTYTLTIEYIKMALSEVESKGYFRRILAVTFTIKAAEEMRQRILHFLAGMSDYPTFSHTPRSEQPKVLAILDKIQSELAMDQIQLSKEELASRAATTLQQILQDYGLFSVMTIDSFVQRLSSSFIEELKLPSHFEVLLDSKGLINELINQLLEKVNGLGNPELNELILSFANKEIAEGRSWNRLRESLYEFLKISLEEKYLAVEPHLSKFGLVDFQQLEIQLKASMEGMVQEMKLSAQRFLDVIAQIGVEDGHYFQGSNGPVGIMRKFLSKNSIGDDAYKYLHTAVNTDSWTSAKAPKAIKESINTHAGELSHLGQQFLALQSLYLTRYNFLNWVLKDLKKMALLNLIQREMQLYQQENLAIPISEFAKRVYDVISNDPIPFIYEKLGDRYFHIFIDEFQDTSILQWKNFMPLLENATSVGKRSLLVGDAKQSIYKFRGGEVSLIASLATQDYSLVSSQFEEDSLDEQRFEYLLHQINPKALGDNYRSAKEIVEFNNAFYQSLTRQESLIDICSLITPLYGTNLTQNPKVSSTDFTGHVDLIVYEKSEEKYGFTEPENEFMFEQVHKLIQHNVNLGFRLRDIAILTRKNKYARYIALRLKEIGVPVISSDSLLVHYSPVVGFLLSFLALQDDEDENLFLYELIYQFGEIKGVMVSQEDLDFINHQNSTRAYEKAVSYFSAKGFSIPVFSDLLKWIYELVSAFDLLNHSSGQEYLWKFLDILNDYVLTKDKVVSHFLAHFNQNRNSYCISSASTENAVTISSIHKSKGLEYPVVIVPFVNWTIAADNERIWYDLSELELTDLEIENSDRLNHIYGRVNASEPAAFSTLSEQVQREKETIFLDALNMLYVATTRPKQVLHLLLSVPTIEMHNKTISSYDNSVGKLVYEFALESGIKEDLPEFLQSGIAWNTAYYTFETSALIPKLEHEADVNTIKNVQIHLHNDQPKIALRVNSSPTDLYTAASKKREIGNQLHNLLAQLPDIEAWPSIRSKTFLDVSSVDALLEEKEVQTFFNKDLLAFKEVDLLCPDGSIVRPDRVNKVGDALQVIDFKTGKPTPSHHDQINKYKQTLVSMGHKVCQGVLIYVESKELVYV